MAITEPELYAGYRGVQPAVVVTEHATMVVLTEAIRERWADRRWYRAHPFTVDWPLRWENEVQLRELVRVARKARRIARPFVELVDPVGQAKAAADDYFRGDHHIYPAGVGR